MAILKANADGSSNAQIGDLVVTGGGVFKKTATGSEQVLNSKGENILKDLVGVASTGSAAMVDVAYGLLGGKSSGSAAPTIPKTNPIDAALNNTQVFDSATNYDSFTTPDYSTSGSGGNTFNFGNIFGYAIVGLVLIVVADKFIGGGK